MKLNNLSNATGSRYETPAVNTLEISSEGVLCASGDEGNAFIEDFDPDTNWVW